MLLSKPVFFCKPSLLLFVGLTKVLLVVLGWTEPSGDRPRIHKRVHGSVSLSSGHRPDY